MKLEVVKDSIDFTVYIFIQDSTVTDGSGLTGLVFNSAGLTCYYVRPMEAAAQLTLATQTVTGAHSDGGFVEVSATNMPGVYRLDLSDAMIASMASPEPSGVDYVVVMLKGAANMAPVLLEIAIVDTLPAVAPTPAAIADAVWDEDKTGHTSSSSFGEEVQLHALSSELGGSAPSAADIADKILGRSLAGGADDASRNLGNAVRALRNRVVISGSTLTVYEEDDVTPAWTATITKTAGDPITEVDPA